MNMDKLNMVKRILQRELGYALYRDCASFDTGECEKCPHPDSFWEASKECIADAAEKIVRLFEEGRT